MKVKELMIGDWVKYKSDSDDNAFPLQIEKWSDWADVIKFPERYDYIPLTAEILERNGFIQSRVGWNKKTYGAWDISVYLSQYAQIEITNYCGRGTDCEEVNYGSTVEFDHNISIHELQHALRLCGLNDLADNFKID